jgi:hypothetical protein
MEAYGRALARFIVLLIDANIPYRLSQNSARAGAGDCGWMLRAATASPSSFATQLSRFCHTIRAIVTVLLCAQT